jgi:hypothetical protein
MWWSWPAAFLLPFILSSLLCRVQHRSILRVCRQQHRRRQHPCECSRSAVAACLLHYCSELLCEVVALLLIIVAFAAAGASCARLTSSALPHMTHAAAAAAGRQLRRQIVGTAAFLQHDVSSTMFALANALQNDASCYCSLPTPPATTCTNSCDCSSLKKARVPRDNCAVVGASRNICCAVGHGERVHAAADGVHPAGRDGGEVTLQPSPIRIFRFGFFLIFSVQCALPFMNKFKT